MFYENFYTYVWYFRIMSAYNMDPYSVNIRQIFLSIEDLSQNPICIVKSLSCERFQDDFAPTK